MEEALDNVDSELRRADHLIYVSLKYTRTVDMLKHVISRLITAIDYALEALLLYAKKEKMIDEVPDRQGLRMEKVKKAFSEDDDLIDYLQFYSLLRKLDKADYKKAREFRRHVTMTATVEGNLIEVTIDAIHEYYDKTRDMVDHIKSIVNEKEEE